MASASCAATASTMRLTACSTSTNPPSCTRAGATVSLATPPANLSPVRLLSGGGRDPWRPGSHSSGGGPAPRPPRSPCGEGVRISLGHAKGRYEGGRYALFSAENVLFCELHSARPYLGGGLHPLRPGSPYCPGGAAPTPHATDGASAGGGGAVGLSLAGGGKRVAPAPTASRRISKRPSNATLLSRLRWCSQTQQSICVSNSAGALAQTQLRCPTHTHECAAPRRGAAHLPTRRSPVRPLRYALELREATVKAASRAYGLQSRALPWA